MSTMYKIQLSDQAYYFIDEITGKFKIQLENGLKELSSDPYLGKQLKGDLRGYWSYRVGIYRIIYSILENEIVVQVLRIHHRKEVYEKMRRR